MSLLRTFVAIAASAIVIGGLGGCYARAKPDVAMLHHRAALDLHCNGKIDDYPAGPRTRLVRGCDQEAIYIHDCNIASDRYSSWETDCTWRLDRGPGPIVTSRR